jgi:hypothetical protein
MSPNAIPVLQQRVAEGRISWTGPLLMLLLIGVLAALAGLGLRAMFAALGEPRPAEAATALINLWNTLLSSAPTRAATCRSRLPDFLIDTLIAPDC